MKTEKRKLFSRKSFILLWLFSIVFTTEICAQQVIGQFISLDSAIAFQHYSEEAASQEPIFPNTMMVILEEMVQPINIAVEWEIFDYDVTRSGHNQTTNYYYLAVVGTPYVVPTGLPLPVITVARNATISHVPPIIELFGNKKEDNRFDFTVNVQGYDHDEPAGTVLLLQMKDSSNQIIDTIRKISIQYSQQVEIKSVALFDTVCSNMTAVFVSDSNNYADGSSTKLPLSVVLYHLMYEGEPEATSNPVHSELFIHSLENNTLFIPADRNDYIFKGWYYDSLLNVPFNTPRLMRAMSVSPVIDNAVVMNLFAKWHYKYLFQDTVRICEKDTVWFRSRCITDLNDGIYNFYDSLKTISLKDSIYQLNVVAFPKYLFAQTMMTVCENEGYRFGNNIITESGLYFDSLTTLHGCDSVISREITVFHSRFRLQSPDDIEKTLSYGLCDTTMRLEEMPTVYNDGTTFITDTSRVIPSYFAAGDTTWAIWTMTDNCNISRTAQQAIIIHYPPCGNNESIYAIDYEGNRYNSKRIGCNCWMVENLKSTIDAHGDSILDAKGYYAQFYPDRERNVTNFGRLYSWQAMMGRHTMRTLSANEQGICPSGWYIPEKEDYDQLQQYAAEELKSNNQWFDGIGNNRTGFNALPAGYEDVENLRFSNLKGNAYFWSSNACDENQAYGYELRYGCTQFLRILLNKDNGLSVRCIKK